MGQKPFSHGLRHNCIYLIYSIKININGASHGKGCRRKKIGQSAIVTRILNTNHTWSSGIGSDVADVLLTAGNFQEYPEL